jgi:hypothetical protein
MVQDARVKLNVLAKAAFKKRAFHQQIALKFEIKTW